MWLILFISLEQKTLEMTPLPVLIITQTLHNMKRKIICENYACLLLRSCLEMERGIDWCNQWFAQSWVFPSLDKFHSTLLTFWYHWRPQAHFQGLQDIVLTIIPTWKDQLSTPPQFTCFLGWFTQRKISLSLILGHTAHCMHDRTWAGSFVGAVGVMETWKSRVKHIK